METEKNIIIDQQFLPLVKQILDNFLPNKKVWAFELKEQDKNDDLFLVAFEVENNEITEVAKAFEASSFPHKVNLLIWEKLPEDLQVKIKHNFLEL